jgi:ribosomal protein S18 acetylase RimI-like enzyme
MDFASVPASNYPLSDLVSLLNQGFEDYFIPIQFTNSAFVNMLHKDGIDLSISRILHADQEPCGMALIARRGALRACRLAAMGIAKAVRGKGAGSWLMKELIADACGRGDREMVLEVIEQNEPAVRLYRKYGFKSVRRLIGCNRRSAEESEKSDLQEIDLQEMSQLISQHGLPDLPWQLSGESLVQMNPPVHAYRDGQVYVVISNPEAEHVVIWSLLVEREARGHRLGTKMLRGVVANLGGKTWHVPAICPEEFEKVFERAGFEKETLSQWQMKLEL